MDDHEFYREAIRDLSRTGIPFLIGGAIALEWYTGMNRRTKDLDIFLRPNDVPALLQALASAGYRVEIKFPHWLAKASKGPYFIDMIFGSGNGICPVDHGWFQYAVKGEVLGMPVWINPVEEMIWSKAFVMERERYDGADIAYLLKACAERLDWKRLFDRFGERWRVLFSHLILFGFIYPSERARIPEAVMRELIRRLEQELTNAPEERLCQGTLLSWSQYLTSIQQEGYQDARHPPKGTLSEQETDQVTETFKKEQQRLAEADKSDEMIDKTVKKVTSAYSPKGDMGQKYLASGKTVSMRLWEDEPPGIRQPVVQREYETVGYVIKGRAELHIEGQMVLLEPGDSWAVPKGAKHFYNVLEPLTAVEATSPPAEVHGRDSIQGSDEC